jgi:hypothetical protein
MQRKLFAILLVTLFLLCLPLGAQDGTATPDLTGKWNITWGDEDAATATIQLMSYRNPEDRWSGLSGTGTFRDQNDECSTKAVAYANSVCFTVACSRFTIEMIGQVQPNATQIIGGYRGTVSDGSGKFTMVKNKP